MKIPACFAGLFESMEGKYSNFSLCCNWKWHYSFDGSARNPTTATQSKGKSFRLLKSRVVFMQERLQVLMISESEELPAQPSLLSMFLLNTNEDASERLEFEFVDQEGKVWVVELLRFHQFKILSSAWCSDCRKSKSVLHEENSYFVSITDLMNRANGGVAILPSTSVSFLSFFAFPHLMTLTFDSMFQVTKLDSSKNELRLSNDLTVKFDRCLVSAG